MKEELLLLRNQLKMGHRISFAEAMLLQRAIDILVNKTGNSPAQSDCCPAQSRGAPAQDGNSPVVPESCSAQFGNFQHYWHSKGYVMVPKEPTEAMCDISHIGVDVYCGITDDNEYYSIGGADAAKVWKAMLAAAPQEVK
ncbi:TPA: hypothetical protein MXD74_000097 [Klebsiella pneumoniae]|nr:hypothetical protein [Klebsiella pneumoniae]HCA5450030.1 hypothetical protein [Klebsiella pneumoniae]HCC2380765.1 hypothetical protein [Klebsiella pneumoniae]HDK6633134.1 hypothetical protein [Klebsiella pneumoniae]HDK6898418.1 hypothetical protein [Klebsiella pneumoniae]